MAGINIFERVKIQLYKAYSKDPGKMLIHTGVIGWAMSSMAQICAIMLNDKIPKEQKMFMIPQEFADAVINIISFYAVTRSITGAALKAVKTGKFLPKNVREYFPTQLAKNGKKICGLGNWNFNIEKNLPKHLLDSYYSFKNGVDVLATLTGSIISCNILTPILRNIYASHRQKQNITKMNTPKDPTKPQPKYQRYNPLMGKSIYSFTNSGNLRI